MTDEFDVIVIGAGPAGEHFLGKATAAGLSTAIVEVELAGGECSYWGCIPSKTLLRPGRALAAARGVPGAREAVSGRIDAAAALSRRDELVAHWHDDGQVAWIEGHGGTLFRGKGRLDGERAVVIEASDGATRRITARRAVVIATGSAATVPPISGLGEAGPWDNRDATAAESVPARLCVLGGGAIGVELAQAWSRLGATEVTVVELGDHLLPAAEPFAGELVAAALGKEGVALRLGRRAVAVERDDREGPVTLVLDDGQRIESDELLVAVGRRPRTDGIGLETVGLEPGKPIVVDAQLRVVGAEGGWLYALGDANGRALLTHMGKYQARIAARVIAGENVEDEADGRAVSSVVFTDPQVAQVGFTERDALQAGLSVRCSRVELSSVAAAAIESPETIGIAQLVIETNRQTIVGATFVGPDLADLLHAATIAVVGAVPIERLRHAVAAFPSISEVWLELVEGYVDGSTIS